MLSAGQKQRAAPGAAALGDDEVARTPNVDRRW